MAKYRKKIVYIDAVRWRGHDRLGVTVEPADNSVHLSAGNMHLVRWEKLPDWLPKPVHLLNLDQSVPQGEIRRSGDYLYIGTSQGVEVAAPGDWIVRDQYGEIYPCKSAAFARFYELCEDCNG